MNKIIQLKMPLDFMDEDLKREIAKKMKMPKKDIFNIKILKKSVDARNKNDIFFMIKVEVEIGGKFQGGKELQPNKPAKKPAKIPANAPVIIGSGPAGLFAALFLAEAGLDPIIIERGKEVDKRAADIEEFKKTGELNTESNIQFGEGGAGTFSDGKLTTGIKDERVNKVFKTLFEAGAPEEILYEAKPHIGTDKLRKVIVNLREKIIASGGRFLFGMKFIGFEAENNKLKNITVIESTGNKLTDSRLTGNKRVIETDTLILAIGHSARDTYEMLYANGVKMIPKPFSVGLRIEHRQDFINRSQYGKFHDHPALGAADYKLSYHLKNNRGVYTFCMCPGGYVVPASTEKNMLCVNGMSEFKRDAVNANSAVLVGVNPEDFTGAEDLSEPEGFIAPVKFTAPEGFTNPSQERYPLNGMIFQRKIEMKAYVAGGRKFKAPVQLAKDFINGIGTKQLEEVMPSYPMGYNTADLSDIFPPFINEALKEGLTIFNRQIDGFACNGAVLTGTETRSSSPVRILRNEKMQSNISGIYPCGEGAGYAGGIVSSAVDGIKIAEEIL